MTCELTRGINAPALPLPASSHQLTPAGGRGGCWASSLGTERAEEVEGGSGGASDQHLLHHPCSRGWLTC